MVMCVSTRDRGGSRKLASSRHLGPQNKLVALPCCGTVAYWLSDVAVHAVPAFVVDSKQESIRAMATLHDEHTPHDKLDSPGG